MGKYREGDIYDTSLGVLFVRHVSHAIVIRILRNKTCDINERTVYEDELTEILTANAGVKREDLHSRVSRTFERS